MFTGARSLLPIVCVWGGGGLYLQGDQRCGTSHVSLMTAACKLTCKSGAQSVFLFLSFHFLRGSWLAPLSLQTCQPQWAFAPCFWQGVFICNNKLHSKENWSNRNKSCSHKHPSTSQTRPNVYLYLVSRPPMRFWFNFLPYKVRDFQKERRRSAQGRKEAGCFVARSRCGVTFVSSPVFTPKPQSRCC